MPNTTCAVFEADLYSLRVAFKAATAQLNLTYSAWRALYVQFLDDEEAIYDAHGKPGKRPPNPPAVS